MFYFKYFPSLPLIDSNQNKTFPDDDIIEGSLASSDLEFEIQNKTEEKRSECHHNKKEAPAKGLWGKVRNSDKVREEAGKTSN